MANTLAELVGLGPTWTALLHPQIRSLQVPQLPGIHCNQCRMVEEGGFHPFARCCNIYPEFPNFLLGEILEKGQPAGSKSTVAGWIKEGRSGPAYAHKPPAMHERYNNQNYDNVSEIPPCPLLNEEGHCTVYAQRPHTCIEYNCVYPLYPEIIGFWHAFHSLLGLHSYLTSRYLLHALGWNVDEYQAAWKDSSNDEIWGGLLTMQPDFHSKLWNGQHPERFYKDCSRYVLDNRDSIREEVEMYRRHQLLEQAETNNNEERLQALQQLPQRLNVLEPPLALWEEVSVGRHIPPEENPWTLTEFEGYILWLHKAMLGRYAVELSRQPAS